MTHTPEMLAALRDIANRAHRLLARQVEIAEGSDGDLVAEARALDEQIVAARAAIAKLDEQIVAARAAIAKAEGRS